MAFARARPLLVLAHRWVGLVLAAFLVLAGLTGALLAWNHELDAAINARWMQAQPPAPGAQRLDPITVREQVARAYPQAQPNLVRLGDKPGESLEFWMDVPDGATHLPNQVFVDPYTGQVLGARRWGEIGEGWHNLMPFIYRLHMNLALDTVGTWVFGIVALLWTLDCFVGAALCLPSRAGAAGASWWSRWVAAWKVRWRGGAYKLPFDLHRAGGLWLWAMLFVIAWSSVSLNLNSVYRPVMGLMFEHQAPLPERPAADPGASVMGWQSARRTGERWMAEVARSEGFTVHAPDRLMYDPQRRLFRYVALTDRDIASRWGSTSVWFDAGSGDFVGAYLPSGKAAGDTIDNWLIALHLAALGGVPYQLFVSLTGLGVVVLSGTGVYLWWRKRRARSHAARPATRVSASA